MRNRRWNDGLYRVVAGLEYCFAAAGAMAAALNKCDTPSMPAWIAFLAGPIRSAQRQTWWIVPGTILAILLAGWWKRSLGPPAIRQTVAYVLEQVRQHTFGSTDDPVHHHRVTLFRHVGFRWPWGRSPAFGWLEPYERAGQFTLKTNVIFRVPPDHPDDAEGVAGEAFKREVMFSVGELPDVTGKNSKPTKAHIADYAKKAFVDVKWVEERKPPYRALCGIPVVVKGTTWGVLVLDSRNPLALTDEVLRERQKYYQLATGILDKLLAGE